MSEAGLLNVTTPRLGLNQPDVGADIDVWGDLLNANATILDQALLVGQAAAAYLALAGGTLTGQVLGNLGGTAGAPSFATSTSSGMYPIGANVGISAFGSLLFMFGLSANISYVTLNMNNNRITGLAMPTTVSDAVNVQYLQNYPALLTTGGTMTGPLTLAADGAAAMQPVTVQQFNAMAALMAPLASPGFTGTPTAPTASPGTNTTQLATTAFVEAALAGNVAGVSSFNTRTGVVTLALADVTGVGGAPLASPGFSGVPTAPTASPGTNTAQLATTAFVEAALAGSVAGVSSFNTRTGAVTLQLADVTGVGGAPLASPAFTGTPTAPTATAGTNTTQLATTAFVTGAVAAGVSSFNTRTGAVTLQLADVTGVGGAPLASPGFSGVPTAPTATAGTNTTQLASTAFVTGAVAAETANVVSNPNAIDNSGFVVNQRGYTSGAALAAGAYGFDRWKGGASGCTLTFAAPSAATIVTITAGSLQQVVEGAGLLTGSYRLSWTGTAQGRVGAGSYAASPVAVSATANTNLTVEFNAGTLSRVKLELGTNVTVWQPLPPQQDLAKCQRFYQSATAGLFAYSASGVSFGYIGLFVTTMRAAPTLTIMGSPSCQNAAGATIVGFGQATQSFQAYATANAGPGLTSFYFNYSASADL